jgi:hypothetical protein
MAQCIGDDIVLTQRGTISTGLDTGVAIFIVRYRGLFWYRIRCFKVTLGEYNAAFVQDDYT